MPPDSHSLLRRLDARDFTVVSALYRDPKPITPQYPAGWKSRCEQFVVMSGLKSAAKVPAMLYADDHWGTPEELHLYPRTYVQLARHLVSVGRVAEVPGA